MKPVKTFFSTLKNLCLRLFSQYVSNNVLYVINYARGQTAEGATYMCMFIPPPPRYTKTKIKALFVQ